MRWSRRLPRVVPWLLVLLGVVVLVQHVVVPRCSVAVGATTTVCDSDDPDLSGAAAPLHALPFHVPPPLPQSHALHHVHGEQAVVFTNSALPFLLILLVFLFRYRLLLQQIDRIPATPPPRFPYGHMCRRTS